MPAYAVIAVMLLVAEVVAIVVTGHRPVGWSWSLVFWLVFVWRVTKLGGCDWRAFLERGLRLSLAFAVLAGLWFAAAPRFGVVASVSAAMVVVDVIYKTAAGRPASFRGRDESGGQVGKEKTRLFFLSRCSILKLL